MIAGYTLEAVCAHPRVDAVWITAEKDWWEPLRKEIEDAYVSKLKGISLPGENRQLSIRNALRDMRELASEEDVVVVHDAVRPCVSEALIADTIDAVSGYDGAVPVLPMKDTVYSSEDGRQLSRILERSKILAGQAPEAFLYGKYLAANEALSAEAILKLSGSAEPALLAGMNIATLPGEEKNFKITTNEDLDRFVQIVEQGALRSIVKGRIK